MLAKMSNLAICQCLTMVGSVVGEEKMNDTNNLSMLRCIFNLSTKNNRVSSDVISLLHAHSQL